MEATITAKQAASAAYSAAKKSRSTPKVRILAWRSKTSAAMAQIHNDIKASKTKAIESSGSSFDVEKILDNNQKVVRIVITSDIDTELRGHVAILEAKLAAAEEYKAAFDSVVSMESVPRFPQNNRSTRQ